MEYFAVIWFLLLIPYSLFCLKKYLQDRKSDMRQYLEPEAVRKGFIIKKIAPFKASIISGPSYNWEAEDIIVHYGVAGHWAVISKFGYGVSKQVTLIDKDNKEYSVVAFVCFSGFHRRKLMKVRWEPKLETLGRQ